MAQEAPASNSATAIPVPPEESDVSDDDSDFEESRELPSDSPSTTGGPPSSSPAFSPMPSPTAAPTAPADMNSGSALPAATAANGSAATAGNLDAASLSDSELAELLASQEQLLNDFMRSLPPSTDTGGPALPSDAALSLPSTAAAPSPSPFSTSSLTLPTAASATTASSASVSGVSTPTSPSSPSGAAVSSSSTPPAAIPTIAATSSSPAPPPVPPRPARPLVSAATGSSSTTASTSAPTVASLPPLTASSASSSRSVEWYHRLWAKLHLLDPNQIIEEQGNFYVVVQKLDSHQKTIYVFESLYGTTHTDWKMFRAEFSGRPINFDYNGDKSAPHRFITNVLKAAKKERLIAIKQLQTEEDPPTVLEELLNAKQGNPNVPTTDAGMKKLVGRHVFDAPSQLYLDSLLALATNTKLSMALNAIKPHFPILAFGMTIPGNTAASAPDLTHLFTSYQLNANDFLKSNIATMFTEEEKIRTLLRKKLEEEKVLDGMNLAVLWTSNFSYLFPLEAVMLTIYQKGQQDEFLDFIVMHTAAGCAIIRKDQNLIFRTYEFSHSLNLDYLGFTKTGFNPRKTSALPKFLFQHHKAILLSMIPYLDPSLSRKTHEDMEKHMIQGVPEYLVAATLVHAKLQFQFAIVPTSFGGGVVDEKLNLLVGGTDTRFAVTESFHMLFADSDERVVCIPIYVGYNVLNDTQTLYISPNKSVLSYVWKKSSKKQSLYTHPTPLFGSDSSLRSVGSSEPPIIEKSFDDWCDKLQLKHRGINLQAFANGYRQLCLAQSSQLVQSIA